MSFNEWLSGEAKTILEAEIPELATMSLGQYIETRLAAAIEAATPVLIKDLLDALLGPVATQIEGLASSIPGATAGLLTNELNQLPQQINTVLNIPAELATAVENLPTLVADAIKGFIQHPFGEEKK